MIGFYDYPLIFLEKLNIKSMTEEAKGEEFNKSLSTNNIADTCVAFILNLNTKTDVSP